jgi:hypothetical protein
LKLAMGAGSGGGFPRGAGGVTTAAAVSGWAAEAALARTVGSLGVERAARVTFGRLAGLLAARGLLWALFKPPRFSPLPLPLRARTAPGRFALARDPPPGFFVLEVLMTRARRPYCRP